MKRKRMSTVLLAVVMMLVFTACGSETDNQEAKEAEETRTVVETEVSDEPTAEPEVRTVEEPKEPEEVSVQVSGQDRKVSLPKGTMVWLSATGKKFHNKNDCGNMNPDKAVQKPVEEVAADGIEACENCY